MKILQHNTRRSPHEEERISMRTSQTLAGTLIWLFATSAAFGQCITTCGTERWDIKTGCDSAADSIDLDHATDTTIGDLRGLTPPDDIRHFQGRLPGVEDQQWVVEGTLTLFKPETDKDYHLVIKDKGKTMIAEIPKTSCVIPSSPFHDDIQATRDCFENFFNHAKSKKNLHLRVRITGIAFFDLPHSTPQTGHAPNNIEIHPVLGISFLDDDV